MFLQMSGLAELGPHAYPLLAPHLFLAHSSPSPSHPLPLTPHFSSHSFSRLLSHLPRT